MHEQTQWYIPNRLIYSVYSGQITFEDIKTGQQRTLNLLETQQISKTIHFIVEVKSGKTYAPALFNLQTLKNLYHPILSHKNLGWIVVIDPTPNPIFKLLGTVITNSMYVPLHICTSLQQAMQFLYQTDPTLQSESTSTCGET